MEWFVRHDGKQLGPFSDAQLAQLVQEGKVGPDTPIRQPQDPRWFRAGQVPGVITGPIAPPLAGPPQVPAAVVPPPVQAPPIQPGPGAPFVLKTDSSPTNPAGAPAANKGPLTPDEIRKQKNAQNKKLVLILGVAAFAIFLSISAYLFSRMLSRTIAQPTAPAPVENPPPPAPKSAEANPVSSESDPVSPAAATPPPKTVSAEEAKARETLSKLHRWSPINTGTQSSLKPITAKLVRIWLASDLEGTEIKTAPPQEKSNSKTSSTEEGSKRKAEPIAPVKADYIFVELLIANAGEKPLELTSWTSVGSRPAVLADDAKNPLLALPAAQLPAKFQTAKFALAPQEEITQTLIFSGKELTDKLLHLAMPYPVLNIKASGNFAWKIAAKNYRHDIPLTEDELLQSRQPKSGSAKDIDQLKAQIEANVNKAAREEGSLTSKATSDRKMEEPAEEPAAEESMAEEEKPAKSEPAKPQKSSKEKLDEAFEKAERRMQVDPSTPPPDTAEKKSPKKRSSKSSKTPTK